MTINHKKADKDDQESLRWFWDGLDSYLAKNQLKQTRQRRLIVRQFLEMKSHVDAEDLYASVRKDGHSIGLATIYRTLNLLKDAGLAEQNSFADGRAVFEILKPGDHHDHLVCLGCGQVIEFENQQIESIQKQIAKDNNFTLTSHRLDLFGYCETCRS